MKRISHSDVLTTLLALGSWILIVFMAWTHPSFFLVEGAAREPPGDSEGLDRHAGGHLSSGSTKYTNVLFSP